MTCNFSLWALFAKIGFGVEAVKDRQSVARTTTPPVEWTVSLLLLGINHKEVESEASISSATEFFDFFRDRLTTI